MVKFENECVGCPAEMGCLGTACPYMNVERCYCDMCGDDNAEYRIGHEDYCENCTKDYLQQCFDDLSIKEKAELLDIDLLEIE